jgi:hypothetical protein
MDQFYQNCTEIMKKYPRETFSEELKELNPQKWADSIYSVAVDYVYGNLIHNEDGYSVDQAYADAGRPQVQGLIALGGYRLAQTLQEFYENDQKMPVVSPGSTKLSRSTIVWGVDGSVGLLIVCYIISIMVKKSEKKNEASTERESQLLA